MKFRWYTDKPHHTLRSQHHNLPHYYFITYQARCKPYQTIIYSELLEISLQSTSLCLHHSKQQSKHINELSIHISTICHKIQLIKNKLYFETENCSYGSVSIYPSSSTHPHIHLQMTLLLLSDSYSLILTN